MRSADLESFQRLRQVKARDGRGVYGAELAVVEPMVDALHARKKPFARSSGDGEPQSGLAVRVPTPNVSLVDFCAEVEKETTKEEVNAAMKAAAEGPLKGILEYVEEELVSVDFNGANVSSSLDSKCTTVIEKKLVKVLAWYDNEWGFSNRMVDMTYIMGDKL